jgi:hypothetical protein
VPPYRCDRPFFQRLLQYMIASKYMTSLCVLFFDDLCPLVSADLANGSEGGGAGCVGACCTGTWWSTALAVAVNLGLGARIGNHIEIK